MSIDNDDVEKLKKEILRLRTELKSLKKTKKFGLVWEDSEKEADIDDGEYYPYLTSKGRGFPNLENGDNNKNILIEGDNYHALQILQYTHKNQIDVIYIDPPYNTGKKKEFKYSDHWVDSEDGYKHSKWLTFMDKRLRLTKSLLSSEGVIFISIDDNEQARLKLLCDDIFGSKNRLGTFIWVNQGNKDNQAKVINNHEYILAYVKHLNSFKEPIVIDPNIDKSSKLYNSYIQNTIIKNGHKNPPCDLILPKGFPCDFKEGVIKATTIGYPRILCDIIVQNYVTQNESVLHSGWSSNKLCQEFITNKYNFILDKKQQKCVFKLKNTGAIYVIKKRNEKQSHVLSVLTNMGTTQSMSNMLSALNIKFSFPKPINLIKYLISLSSKPNPIILDYFAGSGTTGHAVMDLQKDENSHIKNAKYILVTNNENNICEDVCYERLVRTNKKYHYNSNLEYLKLQTLKYDESRYSELDINEFMIDKLTEIIKVKERCFQLENITDFLLKFDKQDKDVYILQNIYNMKANDYTKVKEQLEKSTQDMINIYILALQNHQHYERKFLGIDKKIVFEPLPENFLKLLRKIQRKKR